LELKHFAMFLKLARCAPNPGTRKYVLGIIFLRLSVIFGFVDATTAPIGL